MLRRSFQTMWVCTINWCWLLCWCEALLANPWCCFSVSQTRTDLVSETTGRVLQISFFKSQVISILL
jgi:hypothetical protein